MNFKSYAKVLWNDCKYLFIIAIFSFLIFFVTLLSYTLLLKDFNIIVLLIMIIPFITIYLLGFIYTKLFSKNKHLIKIVTGIISTIIIIIQIYFSFATILCCFLFQDIRYDNPKDYNKALKAINNSSRIRHFPKKIPNNAKNIILHMDRSNWFGSETIIVKFDIDKNYIDNELEKYNYIHVDDLEKYLHIMQGMLTNNYEINIDNYNLYIIGDREHEHPNEHMFFYHYGIAVKDNSIAYYYTCPD